MFVSLYSGPYRYKINFNRLWLKTSHGFIDESDVNIFVVPSEFSFL